VVLYPLGDFQYTKSSHFSLPTDSHVSPLANVSFSRSDSRSPSPDIGENLVPPASKSSRLLSFHAGPVRAWRTAAHVVCSFIYQRPEPTPRLDFLHAQVAPPATSNLVPFSLSPVEIPGRSDGGVQGCSP
jgi:hypothetical protein